MTNREFIRRLRKARKWVESCRVVTCWVIWDAMRRPEVELRYTFGEGTDYEDWSPRYLAEFVTSAARRTAALAVIDNSIAALQQPTELK